MEHKQTAVTPRDLEDADPLQFQHLVETVWDIFEHQLCEQADATTMLKSAAKTISSIGNYRQIEEDFHLGLLGEYVCENEETLPFLATVMSHIHNQLERELQGVPNSTDHPSTHCAMTTFLKELENKMGADDKTKNVVQEIAEMANQASVNLAKGNPEFSSLLLEIGDTMRDSWKSLRDEVEKCIRHARKKNYSTKNMQHIYKRIICKGLHSAKNIQEKIDSVTASVDSWPFIKTADQMKKSKPEVSSPEKGVEKEPSAQIGPKEDERGGSEMRLSPMGLKKKNPSQTNTKEETDAVKEFTSSSPQLTKTRDMKEGSKPNMSTKAKPSEEKVKQKETPSTNKIIKPMKVKEKSTVQLSSSTKEKSGSKTQTSKEDTKASPSGK